MIKVDKVSFSVNDKELLHNISVEIPSSEITVLIGENGSGKSSFLKLISGVWETKIGDIHYSDVDFKENMNKVKEQTGFLFENPFFYESLCGEEFIKLVCNLRKNKFNKDKFNNFVELFQIEKFVDIPVFELPKGVKQKFGIISVLMHNPKYILLDEPMNGLDPVSVKILKEILINEKK
ncbi:MAG: ABC transporter ATP-binding protein, partial [Candidatus Muirbacterium halophilum]|nr:ABC transporter ATP-binding protein [Candidatus Muirbacterium halophilum]